MDTLAVNRDFTVFGNGVEGQFIAPACRQGFRQDQNLTIPARQVLAAIEGLLGEALAFQLYVAIGSALSLVVQPIANRRPEGWHGQGMPGAVVQCRIGAIHVFGHLLLG